MAAAAVDVIALFGPTAVGKTGVAIELAERLREAGENPVAVSCDAIQVYRGLEVLSGAPTAAEQSRLEHRMVGIVDPTEEFSAGRFAELARGEIDSLLAEGRSPIVVGGTGLYMRAALAELDLKPQVPPEIRELVEAQVRELGAAAMHTELDPDVGARVHPNDRKRVARALELQRAGLDPPERTNELWTAKLRHPTALTGLVEEREQLAERIDRRVDAMLAAGAASEATEAERAGASRTARAALGYEEAIRGDADGMKASHRRYARRQMTWLRRMEGVEVIDRSGLGDREAAALVAAAWAGIIGPMRFEKWQALGNDYLVLEKDSLPFELTAERVHALCDPHFGCHSDGILLLARPADPDAHVAELRIFNPDGSEAELSGNGAREAILYLRRSGWTDRDEFTVLTAAGEIRPQITGPDSARVAMAPAQTVSDDYPGGAPDGRGTIDVGGVEREFQHVSVGNPQCAIEVDEGLEELDLGAIGPAIESAAGFPNRTNVSFWSAQGSTVRARIFERGVGETLSSGTGATGAAVAAHLRGARSPITVVLDGGELVVEIGPEMQIWLTGTAEPVFSGEFSKELVARLEALDQPPSPS